MADLFGNPDQVVRKNLTTENDGIVPAGVNAEGYDFTQIRRKFYKGQWYFAYMDVISVLTDSKSPRRYATELKNKLQAEGSEVFGHIEQLKIIAPDGKLRSTQCFSQVDILRLIEEIPSPKAEPLKREIARLASERIEEIKNPDLALKRGYEGYIRKGMSPKKAMARARGVLARTGLTEEWKSHGIEKPKEFAMLTDRESRGIFGNTTSEMKKERHLAPTQSLRDNMSLSELAAQFVGDVAISGARVLADLNRLLEA